MSNVILINNEHILAVLQLVDRFLWDNDSILLLYK